jgi:hypothetical protein
MAEDGSSDMAVARVQLDRQDETERDRQCQQPTALRKAPD